MSAHSRLLTAKRVLVTTTNGTALTGVVYSTKGRFLILKGAAIPAGDGEPIGLDGDVVVELDRVDFIQVLAP